MTEPRNCPCGGKPSIDDMRLGGQPGPFTVVCSDCYDGAPDAGHHKMGRSFSSESEAIEDWNEQVAEEEADNV